jgi:hypothetical protein
MALAAMPKIRLAAHPEVSVAYQAPGTANLSSAAGSK